MTPVEAKAAFSDFAKTVGAQAHIYVSLNATGYPRNSFALNVMLYPSGMGHSSGYVSANADTFEELLDAIKAVWAEASERHHAERVRKMALEIIRVTAERGTCTEADLRAGDFTNAEVEQFGAEAVEDANAIAANGPFSIQRLAGANAA